jgi:sugar O-acyltransferase (sialic acid O-acetyltransferase NeuD family)
MQDVFIYGAGGHCKVTIDLLNQLGNYHIIGILDDNPKLEGQSCLGYKITGKIDSLRSYPNCKVVVGTATPNARRKIWERAASIGYEPVTLVHPWAYIASQVTIGPGTMILANAIVNTGVKIGKGTLINNGAVVEHDCVVGDFVHIASGAHLAGAVEVGIGAFIGIGATIIEFVKVGKNSIVGAGAVVIKDVPAGSTVVGNPARVLEKK